MQSRLPTGTPVAVVGGWASGVVEPLQAALEAEGHSLSLLFDDTRELFRIIESVACGWINIPEEMPETFVVYDGPNQQEGLMTCDVPEKVRQFITQALVVYVPGEPLSDMEKGILMSEGYSALVDYDAQLDQQLLKASKTITMLLAGPQRVIYPILGADE